MQAGGVLIAFVVGLDVVTMLTKLAAKVGFWEVDLLRPMLWVSHMVIDFRHAFVLRHFF